MQRTKGESKNIKNLKLKDMSFVLSSYVFICVASIFALIVYDVFSISQYLSFESPFRIVIIIVVTAFSLIMFGVILTIFMPAKYIDDTNKSYQDNSLVHIFIFMFIAAAFEELLFRGIIQNLLFIWLENYWLAIIATTVLFVCSHVQYFKKPIMLINITIPSFVFGWVYFTTNNILVPIIVHFLLNIVVTILVKYKIIKVKL